MRKISKKKRFPSWKKFIEERKSRQLRLFIKWACLFLGIFLLVNFLIEVIKNVRFPSWNGKDQFSLVVVEPENVWLVCLKPKLSEAVMLRVPNETIVSGALGFGEVKIGSLIGLSEIEKSPGDRLVMEMVRQNFGIPVEGSLEMGKAEESLVMMFFKVFVGQGKTNLTKLELLRALWFVKGLRTDQAQDFDLRDTQGLVLQREPDDSETYHLQKEQLDIFINRYFSDDQLVEEEMTWSILNATHHQGLAEMVGRLLANSGSMVVEAGTIEEASKESGIYKAEDVKDSYGVGFWSKVLDLPIKKGLPEEVNSDVVIILGEDFWERCCSKIKN